MVQGIPEEWEVYAAGDHTAEEFHAKTKEIAGFLKTFKIETEYRSMAQHINALKAHKNRASKAMKAKEAVDTKDAANKKALISTDASANRLIVDVAQALKLSPWKDQTSINVKSALPDLFQAAEPFPVVVPKERMQDACAAIVASEYYEKQKGWVATIMTQMGASVS